MRMSPPADAPSPESPASRPAKDPVSHLRHELANPLAVLLAEVQLLLMSDTPMSPDVRSAMEQIEEMALRMTQILKDSRAAQSKTGAST
jgi:signal transduction histidine kinase